MSPSFQPLREGDVATDPLAQFEAWFTEAGEAGVNAPEAMAVATATLDAVPSVRMVLMKRYDARGFVFFTDFGSRKAEELSANPQAALLFNWPELGRQVRIEGSVARVDAPETEQYVRSRPRGSQLSALASPQSHPVHSREWLERRRAELEARYEGGELPVPDRWGGFRLVPHQFEFWQHREDRLHDRLRYRLAPNGWVVERLAP